MPDTPRTSRRHEMLGQIRNPLMVAAAVGVLAAACGSSSGAQPQGQAASSTSVTTTAPSPSPSIQASSSASPTPQGGQSPAAGSADCGALAGLTGPINDRGTQQASGKAAEIQIVAGFAFTPTCLQAKPGESLAITVSNTDGETHTFTITDLGIDKSISPGKSVVVHVKVPTSGAVPFFCRYHKDFGQQGAVIAEA
jgi:plastocyanin